MKKIIVFSLLLTILLSSTVLSQPGHGGNSNISSGLEGRIDDIRGKVKTASYKLDVMGTEYTKGQEGKLWLQLLKNHQAVDNATCYLDVYFQNNTLWINGSLMTPAIGENGIHYYDLTVPDRTGVYMSSAICIQPQQAFVDDFVDDSKVSESSMEVRDGIVKLRDELVDGFEDGDLSEYTLYNKSEGSIGLRDNNYPTTEVYGNYSLSIEQNWNNPSLLSTSGLQYYPERGDAITVRFFTTANHDHINPGFYFATQSDNKTADRYAVRVKGRIDPDVFTFSERVNGNTTTKSVEMDLSNYVGEWLEFRVTPDWKTASLHRQDGTKIASITTNFSEYDSGGIGFYVGSDLEPPTGEFVFFDKLYNLQGTGHVFSEPIALEGDNWKKFMSEYGENEGNITFGVVDDYNNTLCDGLGDIKSCAGTTSDVKLYAKLTRNSVNLTSPQIDRWSVTWEEDIKETLRGSGEMHVSESPTSENNLQEIAQEVWKRFYHLGTPPEMESTQYYCEDNKTLKIVKDMEYCEGGDCETLTLNHTKTCEYGCIEEEPGAARCEESSFAKNLIVGGVIIVVIFLIYVLWVKM